MWIVTKSIHLLEIIASEGNAMRIEEVTRIKATRNHTNLAITTSKSRKFTKHRHSNSKSTVLQWSDGDIWNAELHEYCFDKVICPVCQRQAFRFCLDMLHVHARFCVRYANHLWFTDKALCIHPSLHSLILEHFSAEKLDAWINELKLLLEELGSPKASPTSKAPSSKNSKGTEATENRNQRQIMATLANR